MGDNNEKISLTDVVVVQTAIADQKELIWQFMQQIAKMRVNIKIGQDLPPLTFTMNAPTGRKPHLHFSPSSVEHPKIHIPVLLIIPQSST